MNLDQSVDNKNIINLLLNDDINRNRYLTKFLKLITNGGSNQIYSLNGNWGSGKTIFIKKLELLINYISTYKDGEKRDYIYSECLKDLDDEDIQNMSSILENSEIKECVNMVSQGLINSIYFNAWEHDDEEDPILSLIYEIINEFHLTDKAEYLNSNKILKNINVIIKNLSLGRLDFSGINEETDTINRIKRKSNLNETVNAVLNGLIQENCNRLIIFIDELDRCNPKYAVKMLERIKHYFKHDKVIIVISTNILELSNTVSALYGENFSSTKYLDKFFDVRLDLPMVNIEKYMDTIQLKVTKSQFEWFGVVVNRFVFYKKMDMREINRYLTIIQWFQKTGYKSRTMEFCYQNSILELLVLPYSIGLYITDISEYKRFIDGNGYEEFKNFISNDKSILSLCKYYLYPQSCKTIDDSKITDDNLLENVKKIYEIMFTKSNTNDFTKANVGELELTQNNFKNISDSISLLGALSDFSSEEQ